jgi:hypothetical protein
MTRRDEIEDWREFKRNHPGKWWKYRHRRYSGRGDGGSPEQTSPKPKPRSPG